MRLTRPFNGWLMSGRIHPKPRRGNYHPKISELSGQSCDCLSQPNQPRANLSNIFLPGISATTLVNFSSWSRRQTRDRILGNKLWERHCAWCRTTEMILFSVTLVYKITCLSVDSSVQAVWPTASCMQRYMFLPLWTMLLYLLWRFRKKQKVNHSETAIHGWSLRMSTWAVLAHFVPLEGSGNLCGNFYFRFFSAF